MNYSRFRGALCAAWLAVALAGCGGGGGGEPIATVAPLAKYAGTYTYCEGHERVTLVATLVNGGLTMSERSDYYDQANCAGAVVGAQAVFTLTATYVATESARVTGYSAANSVATYVVDRIAISVPATTASITGSGVTTINGQLCVRYTGGQVCIDPAPRPATTVFGGLALTDAAVLLLTATANGYDRDTAYPR